MISIRLNGKCDSKTLFHIPAINSHVCTSLKVNIFPVHSSDDQNPREHENPKKLVCKSNICSTSLCNPPPHHTSHSIIATSLGHDLAHARPLETQTKTHSSMDAAVYTKKPSETAKKYTVRCAVVRLRNVCTRSRGWLRNGRSNRCESSASACTNP